MEAARKSLQNRRHRSERAKWGEPQSQPGDPIRRTTLELDDSPFSSRQRNLIRQNKCRMTASGDIDGLGAKQIPAVVPNRSCDGCGGRRQVCDGDSHDESSGVVVRKGERGRELALERDRSFRW